MYIHTADFQSHMHLIFDTCIFTSHAKSQISPVNNVYTSAGLASCARIAGSKIDRGRQRRRAIRASHIDTQLK